MSLFVNQALRTETIKIEVDYFAVKVRYRQEEMLVVSLYIHPYTTKEGKA